MPYLNIAMLNGMETFFNWRDSKVFVPNISYNNSDLVVTDRNHVYPFELINILARQFNLFMHEEKSSL